MELPNDLAGLQSMLLQVLKELETAKAENAELRSRLGMNSSNSHKPPSSDGYKKIKKFSAFERGEGKRRGGQVGHKGNTLKQVPVPDEVIVHHPEQCKKCGRKFSIEEATEIVCIRQVFDMPQPKFYVREHQVRGVRYCGEFQVGQFLWEITASVQYGKRIWIHTASTERCAYLFAHEKRGGEALRGDSSLLLPLRKGFLSRTIWLNRTFVA